MVRAGHVPQEDADPHDARDDKDSREWRGPDALGDRFDEDNEDDLRTQRDRRCGRLPDMGGIAPLHTFQKSIRTPARPELSPSSPGESGLESTKTNAKTETKAAKPAARITQMMTMARCPPSKHEYPACSHMWSGA